MEDPAVPDVEGAVGVVGQCRVGTVDEHMAVVAGACSLRTAYGCPQAYAVYREGRTYLHCGCVRTVGANAHSNHL
ncbi:hypothetical protein Pme01_47180 [Planosporangium mesophilum]|uniref:Uncharacterized protein n=1 Tax=Planosporangium mesophilum TaxID=689768 RepID=A0A8J3TGJ1_9ACTN|nr:hypothetical protein Pme01_47180 [Planosporangium mesophilum]